MIIYRVTTLDPGLGSWGASAVTNRHYRTKMEAVRKANAVVRAARRRDDPCTMVVVRRMNIPSGKDGVIHALNGALDRGSKLVFSWSIDEEAQPCEEVKE